MENDAEAVTLPGCDFPDTMPERCAIGTASPPTGVIIRRNNQAITAIRLDDMGYRLHTRALLGQDKFLHLQNLSPAGLKQK